MLALTGFWGFTFDPISDMEPRYDSFIRDVLLCGIPGLILGMMFVRAWKVRSSGPPAPTSQAGRNMPESLHVLPTGSPSLSWVTHVIHKNRQGLTCPSWFEKQVPAFFHLPTNPSWSARGSNSLKHHLKLLLQMLVYCPSEYEKHFFWGALEARVRAFSAVERGVNRY